MTKQINNQGQESFEEFFKRPIPWYWKLQWKLEMYCYLFLNKITFGWYHENWEKVKYLFIIRLFGFKPIAYVDPSNMLEHTFVFGTEEEAHKAHMKLENRGDNKKSLVVGWWYGKEEFLQAIKTREENIQQVSDKCKNYKIEIEWLKK